MAFLKRVKVFVLLDASTTLSSEELEVILETPEWKLERELVSALKKNQHDYKLFALSDSIQRLTEALVEYKPDIVFNLCEAFENNRQFESNVVSLLELLGIAYTGSSSTGLLLCKDKGLSKKILSFHRIRVPKFLVSHRSHPLRSLKGVDYPALIKPLGLEASEGISQLSLAYNEEEALARIRYLHEKLLNDAIIEEYIDGREVYVSVLGNKRVEVLPPREIFFDAIPDGEPKFATYKSKWDDSYRKRWGIKNRKAAPLSAEVWEELAEMSKKIYRLFSITGYARFDFRIDANDKIYFIEANPNPSIAKEDDFAASAVDAGYPYHELIARVIDLGLKR
jgi:D-alanine-D-alanine ligase